MENFPLIILGSSAQGLPCNDFEVAALYGVRPASRSDFCGAGPPCRPFQSLPAAWPGLCYLCSIEKPMKPEFRITRRNRGLIHWTRIVWLTLYSSVAITAAAKEVSQEEGEFKIMVGGKEIGTEKYVVALLGDSASSSSLLDFKNPANPEQKVRMESKLDMDGQYRPRSYRLSTDIGGKKGAIAGSFSPNQVMFEYSSGAAPTKKGLLVGKDYTILDTNLFHHFVFLVRLFKFDSKESVQRFEVVIPQEADSGVLKISESNRETLVVNGKKIEAHHLQVDSGALVIHLWVDKQRILHKISVPSSGIEVLRVS